MKDMEEDIKPYKIWKKCEKGRKREAYLRQKLLHKLH